VNSGGSSVTELDASDGSWIATLPGGSYGFSIPSAIVADGSHVWVVNSAPLGNAGIGGSVTELDASNGDRVRTISGGRYGFVDPHAIAFDDTHIWVANLYPAGNGGSVTELDASDGRWVRTLADGYGFDSPTGIAVDGGRIWVTNNNIDQTGGSVTELDASDGRWVRTLHDGYGFSNPTAITADGARIWVASGNSAIVLTAAPLN
jgi:hypothetical protein